MAGCAKALNVMRARYLDRVCVEIVGKHHILIDLVFTHGPGLDMVNICIPHAHKHHIGRVAGVAVSVVRAVHDA